MVKTLNSMWKNLYMLQHKVQTSFKFVAGFVKELFTKALLLLVAEKGFYLASL